jgi:hypothetical protein
VTHWNRINHISFDLEGELVILSDPKDHAILKAALNGLNGILSLIHIFIHNQIQCRKVSNAIRYLICKSLLTFQVIIKVN